MSLSKVAVMLSRCLLVLIGLLCLLGPSTAWAQRNVDLELVTEPGAPLNTSQKWLAALGDLGVGSLRIRAGKAGDRAQVVESGSKQSPAFTVTGLINKRDQLVVPGASFTIQQKAELKAWLAKLAAGKAAAEPREATTAFGLNDEQLVAVHEGLAGKVSFETKGQPVGDVARKILKEIAYAADVDPEVKRVVDAGEVVLDELKGVSYGTALAVTLRPAGLVFAPVRVGREIRLRIADSRTLTESWPIGWPMQQGLSQTLPSMSKFINVEISDVVLAEALASIQGRVQAPFLYDHNGLVRQRIDPATLKVSLPKGKTYYKAILDRLLAQAHLKCEVRVDEANTPLVWISAVK